MLKKLGIVCVFLLFSTFVAFSNCLYLGENVSGVKSGKSSGIITKTISYPFNNYMGISKAFNKNYDYNTFLKNKRAKLILVEEIDGVKNYYYYSKKLPKREVVKGKKVNIQVAISSDTVVIGTPIIYGSY